LGTAGAQYLDMKQNITQPPRIVQARHVRLFTLSRHQDISDMDADSLINEERRVSYQVAGSEPLSGCRSTTASMAFLHTSSLDGWNSSCSRVALFVLPVRRRCDLMDITHLLFQERSSLAWTFARFPLERGRDRSPLLPVQRERAERVLDPQGKPNADRPVALYVESPNSFDGAGSAWIAAAFDLTVVSCFTETREAVSLLLASSRTPVHAAIAAENRKAAAKPNREADVNTLPALDSAGSWNKPFLFCSYFQYVRARCNSIGHQLARKRSEYAPSVCLCNRLVYQAAASFCRNQTHEWCGRGASLLLPTLLTPNSMLC
jgi:hypothetical protein